jgi:hypothetical protein
MKTRKHLFIVIAVYVIYVALIAVTNALMEQSIATHNETLEMIAGMLMGFVAIPVFSLILPLWLTKKWQLPCSFWPKTRNLKVVLAILAAYIMLANFEPIKVVLSTEVSLKDFMLHYTSVLLFHVTYYPLLAVFMFPVMRQEFGLAKGIVFTSFAFAIYHLAQFHNFPAGTTPLMQVFLFVAFCVNLLFYLWSESIILVALAHNTGGAISLAANGALFNQVDFVFFLTVVIMILLFGYMIQQEVQNRKQGCFEKTWWLHTSISHQYQ